MSRTRGSLTRPPPSIYCWRRQVPRDVAMSSPGKRLPGASDRLSNPIRAFLESLHAQCTGMERCGRRGKKIRSAEQEIVDWWNTTNEDRERHEAQTRRLHAAAMGATHPLPPHVGKRWIEYLNTLKDRVRTANRVARWRCRAGAAPVPRGSVSGAQGWEAAGVGEAVAGVVPAGAALGSAACQRSGSSSSRRSVGSDGKRVSTSFK